MKGKHGGSLPKPDSILQLEGGFARISVGRGTHALLKQVAGDESLSKCVRRLVLKELGDEPPALPGQGREVSKATLHSVAIEMAALKASYSGIELAICHIANALGIDVLDTGLRDRAASLARSRSGEQLNMIERSI